MSESSTALHRVVKRYYLIVPYKRLEDRGGRLRMKYR